MKWPWRPRLRATVLRLDEAPDRRLADDARRVQLLETETRLQRERMRRTRHEFNTNHEQ